MSAPQLFALFESSVSKNYAIDRDNRHYLIQENQVVYRFRMPSRHAAGFRVNMQNLWQSGNPPEDVTKMCDALFVVRYKSKDFIIAVEIKEAHAGKYKKQLFNGFVFCEWLVKLFEKHCDYLMQPQYIGLLVLAENRSREMRGHPSLKRDVDEFVSIGGQGEQIPIYSQQGTEIDMLEYLSKRAS